MTSDIQITVIWHTHDGDNKCHNGEGDNDRPCLFPPNDDQKKNQTVRGTVSVENNTRVDAFLVSAWLATNSSSAGNLRLKLGGPAVEAHEAQLVTQGTPDHTTCSVLTDPTVCGSEIWFLFNGTVDAGFGGDLYISWDNDQGSVIFHDIVGQYQLPADPAAPGSQTSDSSTIPPSTASPSSTMMETSIAISQFSTSTSLPPSRSSTSNDDPPVHPSTAAAARGYPSIARTIAPAVIVPVVFVVAAIVGYFLWRRRRRLARIAPSARFKGESPEMKPWLPLDAQRSVSRQD